MDNTLLAQELMHFQELLLLETKDSLQTEVKSVSASPYRSHGFNGEEQRCHPPG